MLDSCLCGCSFEPADRNHHCFLINIFLKFCLYIALVCNHTKCLAICLIHMEKLAPDIPLCLLMMLLGLSLPILRQRWRCLLCDVYWLPNGCCLCDCRKRNTWNTIPVSEQKNTLINRTLNPTKHWIKQRKQNEQKSNNRLARNKTDTESLSVLKKMLNCDCSILAKVKYIFVLTELIIATLFYLNANYEKSKVLTRVSLSS